MAETPTHDFIVVGAGTAGCALAARLSENGRHSVLLLEAGPKDDYPWIHIPIGYGKTMFHPVYNWRFETEPDPGMNNRRIYWPRGRCLGGSSSINGLIYIRGQHEDYDHWAALGNAGWAWKDVLPYFRKLEANSRGASDLHGADGPISCSDIPGRHELIEAIIAGAGSLGVPRNDDFNGARQEGVGYYQLFTRKGWRSSTAVAYLKPARGRPNLRVETDAHATRILFEGTRATAVAYRQRGRDLVARAAREVIVAAGAIQSPQLLQLSGVGPAELLRRHGIGVVADLPGVGENLQDHLQLRLVYKCTKPITTNDDLASWWRSAKIGLQWLLFRAGPLAIGINQGGLFTRVLPRHPVPHRDAVGGPRRGEAAPLLRLHAERVPAPAGLARARAHQVRRPVRGAGHGAQLPLGRGGQALRRGEREVRAAAGGHAGRGALRARGVQARPRGGERRGDPRLVPRQRRDHLPPLGHLPHGQRSRRGGRFEAARGRRVRAARGRLLRHAHPRIRQHQRARGDDRRAGQRPHPGRRRRRPPRLTPSGGTPPCKPRT